MKPPIKAIKKIIKYCKKQDEMCSECKIKELCEGCFSATPHLGWKWTLKGMKEKES